MASACVNNNRGMLPEKNFLDQPAAKKYSSSFGWLSPRISFSRDFSDEEKSSMASAEDRSHHNGEEQKPRGPDLEAAGTDLFDFEFRLEDPVAMLPADELFCNGKLVPLHATSVQRPATSFTASSDVTLSPKRRSCVREINFSGSDPYLFSPKAPRCSSRWKELLGLKKLYNKAHEDRKTRNSSLLSDNHNKTAARSIKQFLHGRGSKPSFNALVDSASTPLLDSDINDLISVSSRLSLSSSSSSHDHDDLPRLSLDSDHKTTRNISRKSISNTANQRNLSKVRLIKHRSTLSSENARTLPARVGRSPVRRAPEANIPVRGVSVDSPRMNSSGKIVFNGLERSSSSPSTFNGSHRYNKQRSRGMERSYSAHVRVTPLLNVPVCSLRAISSKNGVYGLFATQPKRDTNGGCGNRSHVKNRTDRTSPRES